MALEGVTIYEPTASASTREVATDTVGGLDYQIVKHAFGPDGTATLVEAAVGLPVGDAGGSLTVDAPVATPVFVRLSDGAAAIATLPVSAASLPLPSGAATAAKQPALGTAGTASADVITVQGIASMTAIKVDGSAVTQPISAASLPLPTGAATAALQGGGLPSALSADRLKVESVGNVASGAADSGNPVKVGGRYDSVLPTLTSGQRGDLQLGSRGSLNVSLMAANSTASISATGNSDALSPVGAILNVAPLTFNGSTWDRARGDATGGAWVQGPAAHDAVAVGNPLLMGGYAASSAPAAVAVGDVARVWLGLRGQQVVSALVSTSLADGASAGSMFDPSATERVLTTAGYAHNGATWDRIRNNIEGTLLASAARTATASSADQVNYNGRGVHVALNVSSAGTGSITLKIEGKDPISGAYYTLLEGTAVTTNSLNLYKVYPGVTAAANAAASDVVPRTWRVTVTHNNANLITYSVAYVVVV